MKKLLSLLIAGMLLLCGSAMALGLSSDASEDIGVNVGGYEPAQIESSGLSSDASDSIDVDVGSYDPAQIAMPEFSSDASEDIDVDVGGYEPAQIESSSLSSDASEDIGVDVGGYEPAQIESSGTLSSMDEIEFELPEYDVSIESYTLSDLPSLNEFLVPDLEPVYVGMVGQLDSSAQQTLFSMEPQQIAELVQCQYDIISDLRQAFLAEGFNLTINPDTGMVIIDSSLLYATNAYKVTDEGRQILSRIFKIYCAVLSSEKYRDSVSRVYIVGHTDDVGSFQYNLELSRKRAEAVREFCLSDACGVEDIDWLQSRLVSEGHSYSELIRNSDGSVNRDASRRVEIGFSLVV